LCDYETIRKAWKTPVADRGGSMYIALTDLLVCCTDSNPGLRTDIEEAIERVVLPMCVPAFLQFYSKSAKCADLGPHITDDWRKVLSNFCPVHVVLQGNTYHTPEHAFHAAKALCSSKPSMATMFTLEGCVGPLPIDAKRAGGKAAYRRQGAQLDQSRWFSTRVAAQMQIIEARLEEPVFRSILMEIGARKIQLVHFDRCGGKSFWGGTLSSTSGHVSGTNRLGQLLTAAAERLTVAVFESSNLPPPLISH
jgi:predicted NAD-dependent protein-ADP-ribosyltransferase YbiA (DUF1768 family)